MGGSCQEHGTGQTSGPITQESGFAAAADDGNKLSVFADRMPKLFVEKRSLNAIRHLNTLLNKANETLEDGGYL